MQPAVGSGRLPADPFLTVFPGVPMHVETLSFDKRYDRSKYIATRFARYLRGRILDVGCDEAHLRHLLPDCHYIGIDVAGSPDLLVDLERAKRLPFADETFDAVVCSDVLEHLDHLHRVFGELVRCARKVLIVSLPNNWVNARLPIARGRGRIGFYGLPADEPQDRHKWFFNLSEAVDFFTAQTKRHPLRIVECFCNEKPRPVFIRALRRLRYRERFSYLNRYAHTLWAVFEKVSPASLLLDRADGPETGGGRRA
ncbi:class I SAM-dependent methyltransferase [Syntrophobacter fumaroxidans]|uniref:Methyltransferase type 11 n=1 Tax=Syntrophobacter fumaroxidans (strain DSM 10017 / MPOB) TaxID=335543 RepID=A0LN23_SYNFM|nr:class I SAM-dependent methyltransferase [Syntrophobacter fumaroxidans]ABK18825.1 Methyltransferase type 11 [Syntrophobacter fumaroxidans MPOB]